MTRAESAVPLIGRTATVREISAALEDPGGSGVLLVGEAGVGKSATARAVLEGIGWSAPVLQIAGGSSLRRIPFGVFAPYLHGLPVDDAGSPAAVLRTVMAQITERRTVQAQQHLPLIVVDDAHDLDGSSSALLAQLVTARRVKVLVLIRDPSKAPAEVRSFDTDDLLTRIDLEPLGPEEVSALCTHVLGGQVLTATTYTLALATGGNPGLLRAVLEDGRSAGYLKHDGSVWSLDPDGAILTPRLRDLVRAQLGSRSASELAVLETIALAGPVPLDVLTRYADAAVLDRVLTDRLVVVGPGGGRPVSLDPPLYGEVLRRQVPSARGIILRGDIADLLPEAAHSPEATLQEIARLLDCGACVGDETLLEAATIANDLGDTGFCLRAARAVTAPGLRARMLVERARAHARRGDFAYAQRLVEEALRCCTDLGVARDATYLSFELRLRAGASPEDLRRDVARWASLAADLQERQATDDTTADLAEARLGCAVLECRVRLLEGRFAGLEEELLILLTDAHATPAIRTACRILLAELLGTLGRSTEGIVHSREALELTESGGGLPVGYRESATAQHVFLLITAGRHTDAAAFLRARLRASPRSIGRLAVWVDLLEGLIALYATRNREACDRFLLAAAALRGSGDLHLITLPIGMAAYACALDGERERTIALLDEFGACRGDGPPAARAGGEIFVSAATAVLRGTARAREDLLSRASAAEADQLRHVAGIALRALLLLGDTAALDPLIGLLSGVEGTAAAVLLEVAVAGRQRDTDAMVAAGAAAGESGDLALEFAALSLAHRFLEEEGVRRESRVIRRRLVAIAQLREGPGVPQPASTVPSAEAPRLTPTESTVMALVNEGWSNREIADSRGVSVRTVEGHLYRIFAKFGVNRREELRGR